MKVWSETRKSKAGREYEVRLLLTDKEAKHLQAAGVVGELWEVIGMQTAADATVARFELEAHTATGGAIQ